MNEEALQKLQTELEERFPFGIPRKEIGKATGNVLHPRTIANWDCLGIGIEGSWMIGKNRVYPVAGVVAKIRQTMRPVKRYR